MHRRLNPIVRPFKSMPSLARILVGGLLVLGGVLGVLPVLGFWMIPLGLLVLSLDFRWARRGYLSFILWFRRWRDRRRTKHAAGKRDGRDAQDDGGPAK